MYGCGASTCKACYPYAYRCDNCGADFAEPVPNGEIETCDRCKFSYNPKTNKILEYPDILEEN